MSRGRRTVRAELKITQYLCPTQPLLLNEPLLDAYEANMAALVSRSWEEANRLSTDAGNKLPDTHHGYRIHGWVSICIRRSSPPEP
ncbi:MAG: hypothetical protein ACLS63_00670 [Flavonifractor plautii]